LLPSNEEHLAFALREIEMISPRKVLVLGLAFKADTDDLRESPAVPMVESLIGRGYDVKIYDEQIQLDKIIGANRDYVLSRLPHLIDLLVNDPDDAAGDADLIVIAQGNRRFGAIVAGLRAGQDVLDLTGAVRGVATAATYRGLTW